VTLTLHTDYTGTSTLLPNAYAAWQDKQVRGYGAKGWRIFSGEPVAGNEVAANTGVATYSQGIARSGVFIATNVWTTTVVYALRHYDLAGKVSAAEARLLPIRRWSLSCLCRKATGWSSCRRMP
jgi:hypothetical protein